ncbi:hypothetical protein B2K_18245 [Paenibacillus mucilaginosus K02]|uniref:Uncharacterized protein n=1 Tax=Paenibacillus mucilaginosus K02 TaxID=997761 RepID=I0BJU2_9BACL|nr:hypothetical protein B2K_18245 [Paenibacillus mucilaginosus K02]WFA19001.1 hypothetical protein ERY13_17840 [Paenibacillus mucilaginosus]
MIRVNEKRYCKRKIEAALSLLRRADRLYREGKIAGSRERLIQAMERVGEALLSHNRLKRAGRTSSLPASPAPASYSNEPSSLKTDAQEVPATTAVSPVTPDTPPLPPCPSIQEGTTITSYTDTYTDTYNASYTSSYENNIYEVQTEVNSDVSAESQPPAPASPRSPADDQPSGQIRVDVSLPGPDAPLTAEFLLTADGNVEVVNQGNLRSLRRIVTFELQKVPVESSEAAAGNAPEAATVTFTLPAQAVERKPQTQITR